MKAYIFAARRLLFCSSCEVIFYHLYHVPLAAYLYICANNWLHKNVVISVRYTHISASSTAPASLLPAAGLQAVIALYSLHSCRNRSNDARWKLDSWGPIAPTLPTSTLTRTSLHFADDKIKCWLVAWRSGRTLVFDRRTFRPGLDLRLTGDDLRR